MSESAAADGYDLVLKGGRVLDERNGVDAVLDVAVRDGRIAAVGRNVSVPAGARASRRSRRASTSRKNSGRRIAAMKPASAASSTTAATLSMPVV